MTLAEPNLDPAPRRRPRGAKVLMILGAVLLVTAFVGGQMGIHQAQQAGNAMRTDANDVRAGFLMEVQIPGSDRVDLERGEYTVYAVRSYDNTFRTTVPTLPTGPAVTDGSSTTAPAGSSDDGRKVTVTITGPNGEQVQTDPPGLEATLSGLSGDFIGLAEFTVTKPGSYIVEGTGTGANRMAVGPTLKGGNIGRLMSGGLFAALAFLLGGVGFILGAAGLTWFLVAGDGNSKAGPGGLYAPAVTGIGPPVWSQPSAPPLYPPGPGYPPPPRPPPPPPPPPPVGSPGAGPS